MLGTGYVCLGTGACSTFAVKSVGLRTSSLVCIEKKICIFLVSQNAPCRKKQKEIARKPRAELWLFSRGHSSAIIKLLPDSLPSLIMGEMTGYSQRSVLSVLYVSDSASFLFSCLITLFCRLWVC